MYQLVLTLEELNMLSAAFAVYRSWIANDEVLFKEDKEDFYVAIREADVLNDKMVACGMRGAANR